MNLQDLFLEASFTVNKLPHKIYIYILLNYCNFLRLPPSKGNYDWSFWTSQPPTITVHWHWKVVNKKLRRKFAYMWPRSSPRLARCYTETRDRTKWQENLLFYLRFVLTKETMVALMLSGWVKVRSRGSQTWWTMMPVRSTWSGALEKSLSGRRTHRSSSVNRWR